MMTTPNGSIHAPLTLVRQNTPRKEARFDPLRGISVVGTSPFYYYPITTKMIPPVLREGIKPNISQMGSLWFQVYELVLHRAIDLTLHSGDNPAIVVANIHEAALISPEEDRRRCLVSDLVARSGRSRITSVIELIPGNDPNIRIPMARYGSISHKFFFDHARQAGLSMAEYQRYVDNSLTGERSLGDD